MTRMEIARRPFRELAHRANDGLEVTLLWQWGTDVLKVCVCDQKQGAYFEFRPDPNQGLDAFYHPYSYVTRCEVHYEDERLAA